MALGYWQVKRTSENCNVLCEQKNEVAIGNCNLECKQKKEVEKNIWDINKKIEV